jgi:hypothetical protein
VEKWLEKYTLNYALKHGIRNIRDSRLTFSSLQTVLAQKNEIEKKFEEIQWKFAAEIKIRTRMEVKFSENS